MYATLGLASADGQHKSATEFPETPEEGSGVVRGTAMTRVDGSVGGDSATAVVCGAGIAGLLAARVLSERLERVVIVEPDLSTGSAGRRPGVPQGNHIHLMLPGGRQVMDQLVPGLIDALTAAGGIRACVTASSKGFVEGRC